MAVAAHGPAVPSATCTRSSEVMTTGVGAVGEATFASITSVTPDLHTEQMAEQRERDAEREPPESGRVHHQQVSEIEQVPAYERMRSERDQARSAARWLWVSSQRDEGLSADEVRSWGWGWVLDDDDELPADYPRCPQCDEPLLNNGLVCLTHGWLDETAPSQGAVVSGQRRGPSPLALNMQRRAALREGFPTEASQADATADLRSFRQEDGRPDETAPVRTEP